MGRSGSYSSTTHYDESSFAQASEFVRTYRRASDRIARGLRRSCARATDRRSPNPGSGDACSRNRDSGDSGADGSSASDRCSSDRDPTIANGSSGHRCSSDGDQNTSHACPAHTHPCPTHAYARPTHIPLIGAFSPLLRLLGPVADDVPAFIARVGRARATAAAPQRP